MIDKDSFRAAIGLTEHSLEYELAERWLDKNVQPKMFEAAKIGQSGYEFIVDMDEVDFEVIRKVLHTKGYGVLSWPVTHQPGVFAKQVRMKVLW